MLEKSDRSISETLKVFNAHELDIGLVVPTDTGMKKSIMDATSMVREYFQETGFHDYAQQQQGPDYKVIRRAFFVWPDRLEETTASLYRPQSKKGDPRLWFGRLGTYSEPFNLLALVVRGDTLYVVNCSKTGVLGSISRTGSPLHELSKKSSDVSDPAVDELLGMMREIAGRGFVRTMRPGSTGVGMTLETLLGIEANASKRPDFKGIEIKAKRQKKGRPSRVTLFSQVPSWQLSPIGSAWNLLSRYGYVRDGKLRLNHEMNAIAPNSIGFILDLDADRDWLRQNHVDEETSRLTHVVTWEVQNLRDRLQDKHPQTFWVSAKTRGKGVDEEFHYLQVEHTRQPRIRNFDALIEGGVISVDYLMSQKGPKRVRDHGYLFKMHASDFNALFPPSETHVLA
ncbi:MULTISPECIES: MvaI/BcnI family restriction endonuclease [unclassified Minwuia]|uniref:MvaI/BcnI family restriction endonuclease n=1 Tax=unclassified Minwuia TaxID=2618799 RepID=UPI0024784B01|nr:MULTISPECIES: MvaI/BcnI family restriction endonuclease [unclassified Minwuia]